MGFFVHYSPGSAIDALYYGDAITHFVEELNALEVVVDDSGASKMITVQFNSLITRSLLRDDKSRSRTLQSNETQKLRMVECRVDSASVELEVNEERRKGEGNEERIKGGRKGKEEMDEFYFGKISLLSVKTDRNIF
ncbi:hypothetical protein DVH24_001182 [Malus domestica]|uniref:Uncharacterized protein n=1 Tax=Malus domestica TaxID=3750 RepID=A0A498K0Y0_MALDO|nr:hypothetical protein DVH24_001182 [Malus domestica]